MKAHIFVAEKGVDKAKRVLSDSPKRSNWYQEKGKYSNDLFYCNPEIYGKAVMLSEIKQVIESIEIVEAFSGIEQAKLYICLNNNTHSVMLVCGMTSSAKIIKAIADYELVESYKSSNGQAINHSCVSDFKENETLDHLSIKQNRQVEVLDMVDVSPNCEVRNG